MNPIDYSLDKVTECISCFDNDEGLKELVLKKAFSGATNTDIESVLIRVTLLNTFYSTRLNNNASISPEGEPQRSHIDVESMAKHIVANPSLDEWMNSRKEERLKAFDYIATGLSEYKKDVHYAASSFASKYCSWCNPDYYPIMDSYSRGMLYRLNVEQHYYSGRLSQDSLRDYEVFCNAHSRFKDFLEHKHKISYSIKDLDKYLWYYGTKHPEVAIE